jgi:hypothetical protein
VFVDIITFMSTCRPPRIRYDTLSSDLVRPSTVDDGGLEDVEGSVVLSPSWSSGHVLHNHTLNCVKLILFAESEPPSA